MAKEKVNLKDRVAEVRQEVVQVHPNRGLHRKEDRRQGKAQLTPIKDHLLVLNTANRRVINAAAADTLAPTATDGTGRQDQDHSSNTRTIETEADHHHRPRHHCRTSIGESSTIKAEAAVVLDTTMIEIWARYHRQSDLRPQDETKITSPM